MYKSEKIFDLIEKTIPGFLKGVSTDNMSIFLPDFLKEVDRLINQEIINFIKLEKVSTDSLKKANEICMAAREMQKKHTILKHNLICHLQCMSRTAILFSYFLKLIYLIQTIHFQV